MIAATAHRNGGYQSNTRETQNSPPTSFDSAFFDKLLPVLSGDRWRDRVSAVENALAEKDTTPSVPNAGALLVSIKMF